MPDSDKASSPPIEKPQEPHWRRLVFMVIIGVMLSLAQSILFLLAVVQFVIILVDDRQPNERLAEFGGMIGDWVARAARYLSIATDAKPWPFRDMD